MSIDAIAVLRIPEWEPDDELDTRPLDDATLLYLDLPFDTPADRLFDALENVVGAAVYRHDDSRGVFVLPDVADPIDARTYEQVLTAVGDDGVWVARPIALAPEEMQGLIAQGVHTVLDDALSKMGLGSVEEMQRLLREGDPEALKMAQIRLQGAFERTMTAPLTTKTPADDDGASRKTPPVKK